DMALVIGAEHVDINGLALGERSDELDHRGLDAFEHAGPAIAVVRPREPRRFVRCPFGGLAITASARRIGMVGGQSLSRHSVEPRRLLLRQAHPKGAHHTPSIRGSIHPRAPDTVIMPR